MRFLTSIINWLFVLRIPLPAFALASFEAFLRKRPGRIKIFLSVVNPRVLSRIAEKKLLYLLPRYIQTSPALNDIKKQHLHGKKINTLERFKEFFPILDKDTYVKTHTLASLCQNGKFPHAGGFYKSAGTSGKPTLWVESIEEQLSFDSAVAFIADTILSDMASHDYLILNCWAMGSWPTGINFAASARYHGKMVNVGTNISEAIELIKITGPQKYLIAGYPPFIFHLFEECERQKIDLSKYEFDVVSGGEGFAENWRDTLIKKIGPSRSIFSVYGSTDKGLGEGLETNFAYAVRSLIHVAVTLMTNETAAQKIMMLRFGISELPFSKETAKNFLLDFLKREENIFRIPMVFQFDPTQYYNENITVLDPKQDRELTEFVTTVLTPNVTIPRIRYNVHDEGFIMTYEEITRILKKYAIELESFNPRKDAYLDLHLPFLFIYGRSDGTISVDGANIFPQDIEEILRKDEELSTVVNSFQLFVTENYHVGIAIELASGNVPNEQIGEKIKNYLTACLAETSFGYRELVHDQLPSADVKIELYALNDGPYFKEKTLKMRYVKH